jgi:hypothetical protein
MNIVKNLVAQMYCSYPEVDSNQLVSKHSAMDRDCMTVEQCLNLKNKL